MQNQKVLVFTDLDGTLLDHYSYSFEAASPCLKRLDAMGVPVIPNTSKTFSEVVKLQQEFGLNTPFIVENGAAIYIPKDFFPIKPKDALFKDGYWSITFAQKRQYWQNVIAKIEPQHKDQFETFSSMDLARIAHVTGLDEESAKLSSKRQFGEPVMWHASDSDRQLFIDKAKARGAFPLLGGRFLHICGNTNKGKALLWLQGEYERQYPKHNVSSIALGDGGNDIDMLEVADTAVRIASPVHAPPKLVRTENVFTSVATGPQGWQEIMDQLIPDNEHKDY
jgi:mannosyl-3-phosphoglycerate phosphatase